MDKKIINIAFCSENVLEEYKKYLSENYKGEYQILYEQKYQFVWYMGIQINFFNNYKKFKKFVDETNDKNNFTKHIVIIQFKENYKEPTSKIGFYRSMSGNLLMCDTLNNFALYFFEVKSNNIKRAITENGKYVQELLMNCNEQGFNNYGLVYVNEKIYNISKLSCGSYYYERNSNIFQLTEIKEGFAPMFDVYKKDTNVASHAAKNICLNNSSNIANIFSESVFVKKDLKKLLMEIWLKHSRKITISTKNFILNENFKSSETESYYIDLTRLFDNLLIDYIVDSFDFLLKPEQITQEQLKVFIDDLLQDEFVIVVNLPLFFHIIKNKESKKISQKSYGRFDFRNITNTEVVEECKKIYKKYVELNKSYISDELIDFTSNERNDLYFCFGMSFPSAAIIKSILFNSIN